MSDHSQDALFDGHRAPCGKIEPIPFPHREAPGAIGHYCGGELLDGFAMVDPFGSEPEQADDIAATVAACWNACADAGLTVEQLESGIIKKMMDENAANAAALRCDICGTEIVGHPWHGQTEATKATHYCDACRPPAQADTALRQAAQNMVDTAFELTATLRRSCGDCVIYNDDNEADVCSHAASVVFARTAVIKALAPITTEPTNG